MPNEPLELVEPLTLWLSAKTHASQVETSFESFFVFCESPEVLLSEIFRYDNDLLLKQTFIDANAPGHDLSLNLLDRLNTFFKPIQSGISPELTYPISKITLTGLFGSTRASKEF